MEAAKCRLCGERHYGPCQKFAKEKEESVPNITKKFHNEYSSWNAMKSRCNRPDHPGYPYYGAVGITVCERWADFSKFLEDMGPKPSQEYSIERKDHSRGYEPANCKWIKKEEQQRNTTRSVWISSGDGKELLMDLPRHPSVSSQLAYERFKLGWSIQDATQKPTRAYVRRKEYKSYQEPLECPACEARRLRQIETQKRYRAKKKESK